MSEPEDKPTLGESLVGFGYMIGILGSLLSSFAAATVVFPETVAHPEIWKLGLFSLAVFSGIWGVSIYVGVKFGFISIKKPFARGGND